MAITYRFGNSNDIYGYGYFAYIEEGQLVIGESWPREGGITYRGTYRDAKERMEKLSGEDELLYHNIQSYYSKHKEEVVEPPNEDVISAEEARKLTDIAKTPKDPWAILFKCIKERSKKGIAVLEFDEEQEGVTFTENRKVVKKKLESLGYTVQYSRYPDKDNFTTGAYHNRYVIMW